MCLVSNIYLKTILKVLLLFGGFFTVNMSCICCRLLSKTFKIVVRLTISFHESVGLRRTCWKMVRPLVKGEHAAAILATVVSEGNYNTVTLLHKQL